MFPRKTGSELRHSDKIRKPLMEGSLAVFWTVMISGVYFCKPVLKVQLITLYHSPAEPCPAHCGRVPVPLP